MGLFVSGRFFEDHPTGFFSSNWASLLFHRRCHGRAHDFWGLLTARTVDCALWVFDYCCRYRHRALGRFNDFSIGIEMEGADHIPYTEIQYQVLAEVSRALLQSYPLIKAERIVGHSDIAPGRKTDPGEAFQWDHYKQLLG